MEKYAELISILLQHSQRFLDFWNFQIVITLAALGFIFSTPSVLSRRSIRVFITVIFLFIAVFTSLFLSVHQGREERLYAAIQSHVAAAPTDFTPADMDYIDSLEPTPLAGKAGAIVAANVLIIVSAWISPKMRV